MPNDLCSIVCWLYFFLYVCHTAKSFTVTYSFIWNGNKFVQPLWRAVHTYIFAYLTWISHPCTFIWILLCEIKGSYRGNRRLSVSVMWYGTKLPTFLQNICKILPDNKAIPYIAVVCLVILLHIWKIPGSIQKPSHPDQSFFIVFLSTCRQISGQYLKLGHNCFLQYLFQFICH